MEIRFGHGAATKDRNGNGCDNCFLCTNPCDPYIVVKVDGDEKGRTPTVWDDNSPNFDTTVNLGLISENANIIIEMVDNDAAHTDDDLMSRWDNLRVSSLLGTHYLTDSFNSVEIFTKWTPRR